MAMTVTKRKDSKLAKVFVHKIADIRGGVSVAVSELVNDFLKEGTPISAPVNGVCHVCKYAYLQADATTTDVKYKVVKGSDFKVGDVVCAAENGKAYAITAIDSSNAAYDEITVGTTLGVALTAGTSALFLAAAAKASDSTFKYRPFALVGTGKPVIKGVNLDTDAWVIGVTKGNALPEAYASVLKGIINY